MKQIIDYLEQLGLSKIEAKLYMTLLRAGQMGVTDLAAEAKINRTAAYAHVNSLLDKGVIVEARKGSLKQIVANEPERLLDLIERKQADIKMVREKFPDMLHTIQTSFSGVKDPGKVDVKYYKGRSGIKSINDESFIGEEIRGYVTLSETTALILPEDHDIYENALKKNKKLKIYEMVADDPRSIKEFNLEQTAQTGRYFYKFISPTVGLTAACILLYDNRVAIINVRPEISGIVIHNVDYYNNSKKLFDFMWGMLPEVNHTK